MNTAAQPVASNSSGDKDVPASAIKRRKEIWEALNPETATNCRGLGGRGNTEFAADTAAAAGIGDQAAQGDLGGVES